MRILRLMCAGRADLAFVLRAFRRGAAGVFLGGCWPGECHYATEGNLGALNMAHLGRRLLERAGLDPARLRIEWISSAEGIRFAGLMNDFAAQVRTFGPPGSSEGIGRAAAEAALDEAIRLVPWLKIALRDRLSRRCRRPEEVEALYPREEVDRVIREAPSFAIDPALCRGCGICLRRCPAEAIEGGKGRAHAIDPGKCLRCGTCLEVCPPRFGAVRAGAAAPGALGTGSRA